MSRNRETYDTMRGFVRGYWFDNSTGAVKGRFERPNQLSFACGDALARLFGGDSSYAPRYIGFVYGPNAVPVGLGSPSERRQSWDSLGENLSEPGVRGNVQISPLARTPSIVVDGANYSGNGVIFSAHTRSGAAGNYGFNPGGDFADALTDGDRLYHAILFAKPAGSGVEYMPLARVSLSEGGVFFPKPEGFELALDWQISFF